MEDMEVVLDDNPCGCLEAFACENPDTIGFTYVAPDGTVADFFVNRTVLETFLKMAKYNAK
jgi:hypothetical protein